MMNKSFRNFFISIFVVLWIGLFFYESTRHFFLNPIAKKYGNQTLPKFKWLYPPAGWIMFYRVGPQAGYPHIYGVKNGAMQLIDPHTIIETKTIGFDNIHRGIMGSFFRQRKSACRFLRQKFPFYEKFVITQVYYPDVSENRYHRTEQVVFQCLP